jgi:hypothetical protein
LKLQSDRRCAQRFAVLTNCRLLDSSGGRH